MKQTDNEKIILSFILLNYNNVKYTIPCINSIQKIVEVPYEIIVVDNASTDDSIEQLSKVVGIILIKNTINRGFTGGNNDGVRASNGKYIVIINNDTILDNPNINKLPLIFENHGKFDVVGGRIVGLDGKLQPSGGYEPGMLNLFSQFTILCYKKIKLPGLKEFMLTNWNDDKVKDVDWASGCFFAMRRDAYWDLGGFDENIFIYLDEVDLHKQARKMRGKVYLYPEIIIRHYGQISWGSNHYIGLKHNYDSAVYYLKKYHGSFYKFMFILFVKITNLVYLPVLLILKFISMGKNIKINNKLKFCITILAA